MTRLTVEKPHDQNDHDDFGGLQRDLAAHAAAVEGLSRRDMIRSLGLVGTGTLLGCSKSPTSPTTSNTDASLSALAIAGGTITFAAGTLTYALTVSNTVASTTVTATATNPAATIKVNGTLVASGAASSPISLAMGANTITVLVTAADGVTTESYVIAVTRSSTVASACTGAVPNETEGPFPGDGSNGPNVLATSGVVRSDIRSSFGGLNGTAVGVPLTIQIILVSASTCEPLAGRAVYIWHCDRDGQYSLYGIANQNYLRGVQETDASGLVTFTSIFPACYSGRWPHIHVEVYPSIATATSAANKQATTQIALPKEACDQVYATSGYEASITNLSRISLATDMVFSDGASLELATVTGSPTAGMTSTLTIAI
jgi:protocatechuate 3,4-dioxygenase beta subunit